MLEKLKSIFDSGKSMLKESMIGGPARESKAAPDDATVEQLIREAKAYVDAVYAGSDARESKADEESGPVTHVYESGDEDKTGTGGFDDDAGDDGFDDDEEDDVSVKVYDTE